MGVDQYQKIKNVVQSLAFPILIMIISGMGIRALNSLEKNSDTLIMIQLDLRELKSQMKENDKDNQRQDDAIKRLEQLSFGHAEFPLKNRDISVR